MTNPIIGLTTTTATISRQVGTKLMNIYIKTVVDAEGIPLLIPNHMPDVHLREMLQQPDGLLLTGGRDIHPDRYGGRAHAHLSNIDPERDRTEIALLQAHAPMRTLFRAFVGTANQFQSEYRGASGKPPSNMRNLFSKIRYEQLQGDKIGSPTRWIE